MTKEERIIRALHKSGVDAIKQPYGWQVRLRGNPNLPYADILLPDSLPLERSAVTQLVNLAGIDGRNHCCATPDFHPGDSGVAIGSVVRTQQPIPAAIGTDINCGVRLHLSDLPIETFLTGRNALVELLKGDYFYGTRDVTQTIAVQQAMFQAGLPGWLLQQAAEGWKYGMVAHSDHDQLMRELERVQNHSLIPEGLLDQAPPDLVQGLLDRLVRDDGLATVGGGNHFVEFQVVEEILDRHACYELGVRVGQVGYMVHTGSRFVGKYVGQNAQDRSRAFWEQTGQAFPVSQAAFPTLDPEQRDHYLRTEATAANYGWVNRMLVAEIARLRMREVFGKDLEIPLITDIAHNITLPDGNAWIQRKGACPAYADNWLLIPGSMGTASFICKGLGNAKHLCSASHGAGRSAARIDTKRLEHTGLEGVDCITLREERRIEECPAAYKPIGPIIEAQEQAGILSVVAKLRPILTFKA